MSSRFLQNLSAPVSRVHGETAGAVYGVTGGGAKPFADALRRLRAMLVEIDRKRRLKYEIHKSIAHLQSLTDDQLRDIGIRRHEIVHRVCTGNDPV